MANIFTIGHSRHTAEHLVSLLRAHDIARLVDVRSHPASKWSPQFGKAALAHVLAAHAIDYVFLGQALGGRPIDRDLYRSDGSVDYARRAEAPDFQAGIARLVELANDRTTAILCAEEDPGHCHRHLLVTPALRRLGIDVLHIRGDGRLQSEASMDGPPPQLSLFK